jgi:hypothetical protein
MCSFHYCYLLLHQLTGKEVLAKYNQRVVEISYNNKIISLHPRLCEDNQASTNKEHVPDSHRRYAEVSPSSLIEHAKAIGLKTGRLIHKIISEDKHLRKRLPQRLRHSKGSPKA